MQTIEIFLFLLDVGLLFGLGALEA